MVADIARVTYDPTRQYRSLIYQQGRVTLEADNNEAAMLAQEALRLETIDIIGPTGALGGGYLVSLTGSTPSFGAGVFYLGGWRLELDAALPLASATLSNLIPEIPAGNYVVGLLLTEQSVGAVEDQALREVALGGPDSAARTRLTQSFPLIPVTGNTCATAWQQVVTLLGGEGITISPSLQLMSSATLQAGFVQGAATQDPCAPSAAGGYLGADNQMVRVTVTDYTPATGQAGGAGKLKWGWNNAALLYRASAPGAAAAGATSTTLTLITVPVDQEHAPQTGTWVEILLAEIGLTGGNYVAAAQGVFFSVSSGYAFDSQSLVIQGVLPAAYQTSAAPLFVRLWQAEVDFAEGKATPLDNVSGITVTIAMTAMPQLAARPYWHFAVRPSVPTSIYPARYATPQPPDGPRQWLTDLAVVVPGAAAPIDCRVPYPAPPPESCCCGPVLGLDEVTAQGGLQAVVDALGGNGAVLTLKTGTYALSAPLHLTGAHDGLTIEGCTGGVKLTAATAAVSAFQSGLVLIDGVSNLTLRGLEFEAPSVPAPGNQLGLTGTQIGLFVNQAQGLTIEDCQFDLAAAGAIGGAIAVRGTASQVTLTGNRFVADSPSNGLFGVAGISTSDAESSGFDQWVIEDNQFSNLFSAVFAISQLGLVRCLRNVVSGAGAGFIFVDAYIGSTSAFARGAVTAAAAGKNVVLGQAVNAALRPDLLVATVNKFKPVTDAAPKKTSVTLSDVARKALVDQMTASGTTALNTISGSGAVSAASVPAASVSAASAPAPAAAAAAPAPAAPAPAAPAASVQASSLQAAPVQATVVQAASAQATTTQAASATGAQITVDTADFDALDGIAVSAEAFDRKLTPALRIEDNEVTLVGGTTAPWVGIGVALSFDQPGSVMVTGNRVVVPDATTVACSLLAPVGAIVTGNFFWQLALPPARATGQFSLILLTASPEIMVASNVIVFAELVLPARASPPNATGWDLLNTVVLA
jgi:hypothetical protein